MASVLTRDSPITPATSRRYNYPRMPEIIISLEGIANIVEGLKLFSQAGPEDEGPERGKTYFKLIFANSFYAVLVIRHSTT